MVVVVWTYGDQGTGGVGQAVGEWAGADRSRQAASVVVHGRQVDQDQNERQAQFDAQRLPLGQARRDHRRSQQTLVAVARHSATTTRTRFNVRSPIGATKTSSSGPNCGYHNRSTTQGCCVPYRSFFPFKQSHGREIIF